MEDWWNERNILQQTYCCVGLKLELPKKHQEPMPLRLSSLCSSLLNQIHSKYFKNNPRINKPEIYERRRRRTQWFIVIPPIWCTSTLQSASHGFNKTLCKNYTLHQIKRKEKSVREPRKCSRKRKSSKDSPDKERRSGITWTSTDLIYRLSNEIIDC